MKRKRAKAAAVLDLRKHIRDSALHFLALLVGLAWLNVHVVYARLKRALRVYTV